MRPTVDQDLRAQVQQLIGTARLTLTADFINQFSTSDRGQDWLGSSGQSDLSNVLRQRSEGLLRSSGQSELSDALRQRGQDWLRSSSPELLDVLKQYDRSTFAEDFFRQLNQSELPSFLPDIYRFDLQSRLLSLRNIPQYVALFRDDGPDGELLPVPVVAPDLSSLDSSYGRFLEILRASDVPLKNVSAEMAQQTFSERLAEFIAVRRDWRSNNDLDLSSLVEDDVLIETTVISNQDHDTVIFCKGFFTSTAEGFGISNPAKGVLLPGRYSFGIINGGQPDFENILWTCPHSNVRLNRPCKTSAYSPF